MASDTNSHAFSKADYQMLSHIKIDMKGLEDLIRRPKYCSIYRVPCNLRKLDKEAYTPQLISIGPLHFGQEHLEPMQKQKLRYFHFFWDRVDNDQAMKHYKEGLAANEATIRNCYADRCPDQITKEEFVEMLLLDAVFIMELFLRIQGNGSEDADDCILKQTWLSRSIQRDLLLLENQIPMSVLDELYERVVPENDKQDRPRFVDLALDYFECYDPLTKRPCYSNETEQPVLDRKLSKNCNDSVCGSQKKSSKRFELMEKQWHGEPRHFTDLIRNFYLFEDQHPKDPPCNVIIRTGTKFPEAEESVEKGEERSPCTVLRTATKLQEAGVSFEKDKNRHLLDIQFEKHSILSWFLCLGCIPKLKSFKARLRIPQLKVDHTTECVLRNLIAFEQCHYADRPYVCNYVSLIDSLIHTKDDVELLVEREVIVHELGSDKEVATLVNGLCKHVVTKGTCYRGLIDELNGHYQNLWNRTMAALRLVYFRDPWRASSTVVGIAVLVFTIFNFCRIVRVVF